MLDCNFKILLTEHRQAILAEETVTITFYRLFINS